MDWRLKQAVLTDDRATLIRLLQDTGISSNTVLHLAARTGKVEMVREIIKLQPQMVAAENKKLETPLHEACRRGGNDEVIRLLLLAAAANSDLKDVVSKVNSENQDALFIACSYGHLSAVNILLDLDLPWCCLEVGDGDDEMGTPLHVAASKGYTDIAIKLVEKCPELAQKMDQNGFYPLHCACSRGHTEVSKVLLRLDPDLALLYDTSGYAPVHLAAMNGNVDLIKEFLRTAHTSLQLRSREGETVLHLAVRFDKFDAFVCLAKIFHGTNVFDHSDYFGHTISSLALNRGRPRFAEYISSEAGLLISHQNDRKDRIVNILNADITVDTQKDIVEESNEPLSSPDEGGSEVMHPALDPQLFNQDITGLSSRQITAHQLDILREISKEMAESIPSAVVEGIRKTALSLTAEEVTFMWCKKDLISLAGKLETVQALLSGAERKQLSAETYQPWLRKIKAIAADSDRILEEITYEVLRRKVEINVATGNKLQNFSLESGEKLARKVNKINSCIDKICADSTKEGVSAFDQVSHHFIDDSEVVGRDGDVAEVVRLLLSSGYNEDLPVIRIVGAPGQGKTTVAQLVYNNVNVTRHFDRQIWVSVSDYVEVKKVLNEIVKSIITSINFQNLSLKEVIRKLNEQLEGKRYLIVLDDVRSEMIPGEWVSMINSLVRIGGSRGSKIMVNTRSDVAIPAMSESATYRLIGLSDEDSWTMFERRAFAEGGVTRTPHLEAIGKRIARSCGGVPLAVQALGNLMYSKKSESEWLSTGNSPLWESPENSILPMLMLCGSYLPSPCLRHCFSYCSIFPKHSDVHKDELVQIWMALGLLHPPEGSGMNMEDVGQMYFNTMLTNSLFQGEVKDDYGHTISFRIPNLVQGLAIAASNSYCLNLEGEEEEMNINKSDIVHLSLNFRKRDKLEISKDSCQRLQTLFLSEGFLSNSIADFRCLRVLVLHGYLLEELPSLIGEMKHLRYLDISRTRIQKLPASISKLYNLQTLRLNMIKKFPKAFANLISLRHLHINGCTRKCGFGGIGQMTSLQTLSVFVVDPDRGCKIEELGSLSNLKGKLKIGGLSYVGSIKEARTANLCSKSGIYELCLEWSTSWRSFWFKFCDNLLEGLKPHPNLKGLSIAYFKGEYLASWINMASKSSIVLPNLVVFKLHKCENITQLPTLGHLPNLKVVDIAGAHSVKYIGAEFYSSRSYGTSNIGNCCGAAAKVVTFFPALRTLRISSMLDLEKWFLDAKWLAPSRTIPVKVFPCLEKLSIEVAPFLMTIPAHEFPFLRKLKIANACKIMDLRKMTSKLTSLTSLSIKDFDDSEIQPLLDELLENNTSLRELRIQRSKGLLYLSKGLGSLVSLERLEVKRCSNLTSLEDISCPSLQVLKISDCNALVSVPALPWLPRLRELNIGTLLTERASIPFLSSATNAAALVPSLEILKLRGAGSTLTSLPDQIQHLSALKDLRLCDFNKLEALPQWLGNFSSLELLKLSGCSDLTKLPKAQAMKRLTRLRSLEISHCGKDLRARLDKVRGPDWHKISHVPIIKFNRRVIQSL